MTVYFARAGEQVKIGMGKNVGSRIEALKAGCPFPIAVIREIPGGRAEERWLHHHFRDRRQHGEWFDYCSTMLDIEVPEDLTIPAVPAIRADERRIAIVLGSELIQRIDHWRGAQPGISPSRSDVVRQALEEFLERREIEERRESAA